MVPVNLVFLLTILMCINLYYGDTRIKTFSRYIKDARSERDNVFKIRDNVELLCETEGSTSNIKIIQQHDQKVLNTSHGETQSLTYLIKTVKCDNAGVYECVIDNFQSQLVGVMIADCPPLPCQDKDLNRTLFVEVNENVSFTLCVLTYEDMVNYIFINDSTVKRNTMTSNWTWDFQNNQETTQFIRNFSITVTRSFMRSEEYGYLIVSVTNNRYYHRNYTVVLRPPGPPECPTELKANDHGLDNIILSWRPGFDGGKNQSFHVYFSKDNLIWYSNNVTDGQTLAKITGLLEDTDYSFRVVSSNKYRPNVMASLCDYTIHAKTKTRPAAQRFPSYVPPIIVIVCAVIVTVILAINKNKRKKKQRLNTGSSTETVMSTVID